MRQAIEEKFILDVLEHYTTYKTYYRLIKAIEDDPRVEKRKAARALASLGRLQIRKPDGTCVMSHPLLSSAKISHRKPDPRAFQPVLDVWRVPPQDVVVVGDAASFDILGAHRAGMRGVLIQERWAEPLKPHGEFDDAHLMQPDATILQLAELPALVSGWNEIG